MSRFRLSRLTVLSTLLGGALLVPVAGAATLTLEEALAAVDESSIAVLLSREAVLQSLAAVQQERAGLLPNLSLEAGQRRSRGGSFGTTVSQGNISNRFDASINASLDLLDPQRIASYAAARLGVSVAEFDLEATRESVLAAVAETYFRHLRNISRLDVLDANIARARSLIVQAQRMVEAGFATQIDITRAEAQLATAQQARLQQETVVQQSALQLKRFLAMDLSDPLTLEGFEVRRTEAGPFATGAELTAFEQRADYLRAIRELEQNELEVRAAKFGRLPAVALNGSTGLVGEQAFDGDDAQVWSGSVSLNMPVFDGARIRALTRLALSRLRSQELRVQDLRLQIGAEVRLAHQDTRSRYAQIAVAERSLQLAEEELRLAQIRFEQGTADNREIIDAQNSLAIASDNLIEAIYQYNLSRLELARVKGRVQEILDEQVE